MVHYTWYPDKTLDQQPLTNLKFENSMITAQQLNKKFELEEVSFDAWKPRLYLAMTKYIEFVESNFLSQRVLV